MQSLSQLIQTPMSARDKAIIEDLYPKYGPALTESQKSDIDRQGAFGKKLLARYLVNMQKREEQGLPLVEIQSGPTITTATRPMINAYFEYTTLDQLRTDIHTPEQAKRLNGLIGRVREWQSNRSEEPGLSMVLCSKYVGIGKTMIAQSVVDAHKIVYKAQGQDPVFINGEPQFKPLSTAVLITSRELMTMIDDKDYCKNKAFGRYQLIVIDDVGKEGDIKYTKRDPASQKEERQSRYFDLINWAYTKGIGLMLTSNFTRVELSNHFDEPTWSRICQMCTHRYIFESGQLPDYRLEIAKKDARRYAK